MGSLSGVGWKRVFLFLVSLSGCLSLRLAVTSGLRGQVLRSDGFGNDCVPGEDDDCNGGYGRRAALLQQLRREDAATFTLDIGETVGFKGFWRFFKGDATAELLETLGYDVIGVAKADTFLGANAFSRVVRNGASSVRGVVANLEFPSGGAASASLHTYALVSRGGVTLGVTCLFDEARERQTNLEPGTVFVDELGAAGLAVGEMRARGADLVVLLAGQYTAAGLDSLLPKVRGVDVVLGTYEGQITAAAASSSAGGSPAHVVSCPECEGGGSLLVVDVILSGGKPGAAVGSLASRVEVLNAESDAARAPDAAVRARVEQLYAQVRADEVSTVLGRVDSRLDGEREICRFGSCSFGNELTDTLRMMTGAQIGFLNSGFIRDSIEAGVDVTLADVLSALPFGDPIATLRIKGGDLAIALEHGVKGIAEGRITGRFPQVSGIEFAWNPNSSVVTSIDVVDDATGARTPIDLLAEYTMVTLQFVRLGGDDYTVLRDKAIEPNDVGPSLKEKFSDRLVAERPVLAVSREPRVSHSTVNESILASCPDGYESAGAFGCFPCPRGKYSSGERTGGVCRDCLDGFYAPDVASTACEVCPAHARTYGGGAVNVTQCQCEKGYYGVNGGVCTECPVGGVCRGGETEITVAPGYYRADPSPGESMYLFRACIPKEACLGGAGTGVCRDGYSGINCGECEASTGLHDGYYRRNSLCKECVNPESGLLALAFVLSITLIAGLFLLSVFFTRDTSVRRRGIISSFALVVQTFALFEDFFPSSWPTGLDAIFNFMTYFNLNIDLFGLECSFARSYEAKWLISMFVPMFCVVIVAVLVGLHALLVTLSSRWPTRDVKRYEREKMVDSALGASFAIAVFTYTFISSETLSVFDCTNTSDGSFLVSQPSVPCSFSDPMWSRIAGLGILFTFLYVVGIPLAVFFFIRVHRDRWNESGDPRAERRVRVFIDEFKERYWWWLLVLIAWRLLLNLAKSLIPVEWGLRGAVGAGMVSGLLILKIAAAPRVDPVTAKVDLALTGSVAATYFFGMCLNSIVEAGTAEETIVVVLFYIVVLSVLVGAAALLGVGIYSAVREAKQVRSIARQSSSAGLTGGGKKYNISEMVQQGNHGKAMQQRSTAEVPGQIP